MVIDDSFEHEIQSRPSDRVRTILELKLEHPDLQASGHLVDEETGHLVRLPGRARPPEDTVGAPAGSSSARERDAVYACRREVAQDPHDAAAWRRLGGLLARAGDGPAAEGALAVAGRLEAAAGGGGAAAAQSDRLPRRERQLWSDGGKSLLPVLDSLMRGPGGRPLLGAAALQRLAGRLLAKSAEGPLPEAALILRGL